MDKNILSSYLINIYDNFRFLYVDIYKNKLVEFNPAKLDEIFFEYNLDFKTIKADEKYEIKAIFYNSIEKCFDIWVKMEKYIQILKYNLTEQFDKIELKKENLMSKEENNATKTKKLKIERFAQKKGQFKSSITLDNRNFINKQLFQ